MREHRKLVFTSCNSHNWKYYFPMITREIKKNLTWTGTKFCLCLFNVFNVISPITEYVHFLTSEIILSGISEIRKKVI